MKILYSTTLDGICIRRCFGLDGIAGLPERIEGRPVTEIGAYAFSDGLERAMAFRGGLPENGKIWDCLKGEACEGKADCAALDGLPAISGPRLLRLFLPGTVRKVGAYALYGCGALESLEFSDGPLDWGAGVFTGCGALRELLLHPGPPGRSGLKEVLFELRQTLELELLGEDGELKARLVFPEFYEDSVENTPARIIVREMYGCGHMYRYCCGQGEFRFQEYDSLFPYMRAQEAESLGARLALCRLFWPFKLLERAGEEYAAYLSEHPKEAFRAALGPWEEAMVRFLGECPAMGKEQLSCMAEEAGRAKKVQAAAILMDALHRRFPAAGGRRFEL